MIKKTIDGNEAAAFAAYNFSEVVGIYPITPSSPMAEHIDAWSNKGKKNIFNDTVKVVEMQSEAGAAGLVHGSLQAGVLTNTFTASQGLLLMIPNMYKIAGEMLPTVFHVAARSLSTHALSIFGDHQDIYATRATGFCMLASSSVQDVADLSVIAHLSAIKASLPFTHFFDGFRTSHEINKIDVMELTDYEHLIDKEKIKQFRARSLNPSRPFTRGTAENDDIYFQNTESRNKYYMNVLSIVDNYMQQINKITGKNYQPFNYYGNKEADKIIIAMGSVCETIKETIADLNKNNYKVGLIEVHLYRPFSSEYLLKVIPETVKSIAVLDRTKEPGSFGEPLYLDVKAVVDNKINVVGGRYGLSSKNTTPDQIKAVYDMLDKPKHNFTIGIIDDVTNLSLTTDKNYKIKNAKEILIYGYGSDGMVSASKAITKIIGNHTDKYVQAYFEYDSKKSGGVTASHLRISDSKIESTYYLQNPGIIVVTKDTYLNKFDTLSKLVQNGTVIVNTNESKEQFLETLNGETINTLIDKKAKLYIIDAVSIANNLGLKNKISTIMESVIISFMDYVDTNMAREEMINIAHDAYFKKGKEIFEANKKAIIEAPNYLEEVSLDGLTKKDISKEKMSFLEMINARKGNELKVSEFNPDGTFESNTTRFEKRAISNFVSSWNSENCITCNQCSIICPHGVIRPFLLNEEEYNKAPSYIKERCIRPMETALKDDYYYIIGISVKDCTGCGLCIKTCPGKMGNKALSFKELIQELDSKEQDVADYLFTNIKDKKLLKPNNIKGSQFREPKFCFSGACAGCGETSYIKLLTQLFGDNIVISNATGCSSIYGASAPNIPYNVPWASSLFEDNAEYGYGMLIANNTIRNRISNIMTNNIDQYNKELFTKWLENSNDYNITKEVYDNLDYDKVPAELTELKDYIIAKNHWIIGGDGWAYDIGFGGIDHVLATRDNAKILVLDTEVYSNTGGQSSKSSHIGSIASFTSSGKKVARKDLARIAMAYPHVYVAQINMGANAMQVIKAFDEANKYDGPAIIIAYSPCISHGIIGGMENSLTSAKLATTCGYFPTFRYNPEINKFTLDSKNIDFDKYEEFLSSQSRYNMLKKINEKEANQLLEQNKQNAIDRYNYYKKIEEFTN